MAVRLEHGDFGEGTVNVSLCIHIPVLAVAAQEPLFADDVSLPAAIRAVPLFFSVKVVVRTAVTRLVIIHIDPSTPPTVATLFLFGVGWHCIVLYG